MLRRIGFKPLLGTPSPPPHRGRNRESGNGCPAGSDGAPPRGPSTCSAPLPAVTRSIPETGMRRLRGSKRITFVFGILSQPIRNLANRQDHSAIQTRRSRQSDHVHMAAAVGCSRELLAKASTRRTCSWLTDGNHSKNSSMVDPWSRCSNSAETGNRVPRKHHCPPSFPGARSTALQRVQSIFLVYR
jgi:hypothetical protein